MKLEICKLCNKSKELQRSHVIGRSVFNNLLKNTEGNYGYITLLDEKKIEKTSDHWALPMLCSTCESLLNSRYENYSIWTLKNKQKGVKHKIKDTYLQIQNANQYRLIMYVVSIFWRAIHSEHRVFKNINMPIEIENHLKTCILGKISLQKNLIYIRIFKLINTSGILPNLPLNEFITNIVQTKGQHKLSFYTIFEGYYFEINFDTTDTYKYSELGILNPRKRVLNIPYKEIFSIKDIIDYWQKTKSIHSNSNPNNTNKKQP